MHQTRFFAGIALLALSAGGCGLAAAAPERDVLVPAEPTAIDFVDPATVVGLSTATITNEDDDHSRYVHISYPELTDAPGLNRALRADAERQLRDFRAAKSVNGDYPRPELNVDWQLAARSPEAVAVRLRTGEFLGASWGNSTRTFWFDPRTGRAGGSTALLGGPQALDRLAVLVKEQLKGRGPQVERDGVRADPGQFDSMAFNRSGDLVVEFDDCQIGPCSLGRVAVAVQAGRVTPLLSELGRRAQESVREAARSAPPAGPTTTPKTAPTASPEASSNRAGSVNCARTKCVALTFDDGPGPRTGRLLDLLAAGKARATFFTVGTNAVAQPGLLRRMSAEGHLVGNHSWSHRDLSKQATSKIADSFRRTDDAVRAAIAQEPTLARPPYGAISKDVRDVARDLGLALVGWDVNSRDEPGATASEITDRVVRKAHPGAIILMHDTNPESIDAIPGILKELSGKGYTFVTVPELYGSAAMRAGRLYESGNQQSRKQPLT
ncbi:polysaccharide deacetylase family protein [Nonomuraea sp. NPDC049758]|uniref:polysaccharide deacetylase family protein n=1 Tax=Nonomuraea sp. NPDC049758 TaxID=3154360 RepID=UPI00342FF863